MQQPVSSPLGYGGGNRGHFSCRQTREGAFGLDTERSAASDRREQGCAGSASRKGAAPPPAREGGGGFAQAENIRGFDKLAINGAQPDHHYSLFSIRYSLFSVSGSVRPKGLPAGARSAGGFLPAAQRNMAEVLTTLQ